MVYSSLLLPHLGMVFILLHAFDFSPSWSMSSKILSQANAYIACSLPKTAHSLLEHHHLLGSAHLFWPLPSLLHYFGFWYLTLLLVSLGFGSSFCFLTLLSLLLRLFSLSATASIASYVLKTLQLSWESLSSFIPDNSTWLLCCNKDNTKHSSSNKTEGWFLFHTTVQFWGFPGRLGSRSISWSCPRRDLGFFFFYIFICLSKVLSSSIGWKMSQVNCVSACTKGEEVAEGNQLLVQKVIQ